MGRRAGAFSSGAFTAHLKAAAASPTTSNAVPSKDSGQPQVASASKSWTCICCTEVNDGVRQHCNNCGNSRVLHQACADDKAMAPAASSSSSHELPVTLHLENLTPGQHGSSASSTSVPTGHSAVSSSEDHCNKHLCSPSIGTPVARTTSAAAAAQEFKIYSPRPTGDVLPAPPVLGGGITRASMQALHAAKQESQDTKNDAWNADCNPGKARLVDALARAKPQWTPSDVEAVYKKLWRIGVVDVGKLQKMLDEDDINQHLRDAGYKKTFSQETIDAITTFFRETPEAAIVDHAHRSCESQEISMPDVDDKIRLPEQTENDEQSLILDDKIQLRQVVMVARPEWSTANADVAVQKLHKAKLYNLEMLAEALSDGLNEKMRNAGVRTFATAFLGALRVAVDEALAEKSTCTDTDDLIQEVTSTSEDEDASEENDLVQKEEPDAGPSVTESEQEEQPSASCVNVDGEVTVGSDIPQQATVATSWSDLTVEQRFAEALEVSWTPEAGSDFTHGLEWQVLGGEPEIDPEAFAGAVGRARYMIRNLRPASTVQLRVIRRKRGPGRRSNSDGVLESGAWHEALTRSTTLPPHLQVQAATGADGLRRGTCNESSCAGYLQFELCCASDADSSPIWWPTSDRWRCYRCGLAAEAHDPLPMEEDSAGSWTWDEERGWGLWWWDDQMGWLFWAENDAGSGEAENSQCSPVPSADAAEQRRSFYKLLIDAMKEYNHSNMRKTPSLAHLYHQVQKEQVPVEGWKGWIQRQLAPDELEQDSVEVAADAEPLTQDQRAIQQQLQPDVLQTNGEVVVSAAVREISAAPGGDLEDVAIDRPASEPPTAFDAGRQSAVSSTPQLCRGELLRKLFVVLDVDGDGWLNKQEMQAFAKRTGYKCSDEASLDLEMLTALVNGESDTRFYCPDAELQEMVMSLESLASVDEARGEIAVRSELGQDCSSLPAPVQTPAGTSISVDDGGASPPHAFDIQAQASASSSDSDTFCPAGHTMRIFETDQDGWSCSRCQSTKLRGSQMYGCRQCNYDLCISCHEFQAYLSSYSEPPEQLHRKSPASAPTVNIAVPERPMCDTEKEERLKEPAKPKNPQDAKIAGAVAAAKRAQTYLVRPVEYEVVCSDPVCVHRKPHIASNQLGQLSKGAFVSGFPGGGWLRVTKMPSHLAATIIKSKLLNGDEVVEGEDCGWIFLGMQLVARCLKARVSERFADALDLRWPGLPGGTRSTTSYTVEWRPVGKASNPVQRGLAAGGQSSVRQPHHCLCGLPVATSMRIRVIARISERRDDSAAAVRVLGPWLEVATDSLTSTYVSGRVKAPLQDTACNSSESMAHKGEADDATALEHLYTSSDWAFGERPQASRQQADLGDQEAQPDACPVHERNQSEEEACVADDADSFLPVQAEPLCHNAKQDAPVLEDLYDEIDWTVSPCTHGRSATL